MFCLVELLVDVWLVSRYTRWILDVVVLTFAHRHVFKIILLFIWNIELLSRFLIEAEMTDR